MSNEEQNQQPKQNDNITPVEENVKPEKEKTENNEEEDDGEDHRPSYKKKRVIVPAITAVVFFLTGIYFMVHALHFQSTDDAFVEGHIVSVAPRVSGPVVEMLIDDNKPVKKGDLLIVIDPNDYEAKLAQSKAQLAQAKAALNISEKDITRSESSLEESAHDIASTTSKLDFAKKDFKRYKK